MASVYQRGPKWYVRYKDGHGRWTDRVTTARTKTEAKRLAVELEQRAERQRWGLEPLPNPDGGETVGELLRWWLDTYSSKLASHQTNVYVVERYLLSARLASVPVQRLTSGEVEALLQSLTDQLSPQSINHLRNYLSRAYSAADAAGRYCGPNPVKRVKKRRVPERLPDYLRAAEVPRVLEALPDHWRPLFATAIYTGLRKGELLALHKSDVDIEARRLIVSKSHERATTKGGHADAVPLAAEAVPSSGDRCLTERARLPRARRHAPLARDASREGATPRDEERGHREWLQARLPAPRVYPRRVRAR